MMWCHTGIALLTLYATTGYAFPYELPPPYVVPTDAPLIMGEALVQTQLLTLKPNTTRIQSMGDDEIKSRTAIDDTSEKVIIKENNKITRPEEREEADYSTFYDKVSEKEDEYLDIDGDGTPSSFLKQREVKRRAKVPPIVTTPNNAGSAIYITVPIYINTSGGMPLTLSVGGQNVPLSGVNTAAAKIESPREMEPPAKTSQFNRLLHYNDASERSAWMPVQAKNRHRSNLHSRNYAQRRMNSPEKFRRLGSYSFYF